MKYIFIFIFFIFSLPTFAQCESEICKTIEKLQKQNKEYKSEISRLKSEISRLCKIIQGMEVQIKNLENRHKADSVYIIKMEEEFKRNKITQNDSLIYYKSKSNEQDKTINAQKESIKSNLREIEILRGDSIDKGQIYEQFKKVNFFFDDNYIVPFNLPIAPIDYKDDGILDPNKEVNEFLRRLSLLNNCDKIIIVVKINGKVKNKTKIQNQIKREIENRYNIKCNVQYDFINEDKKQIHFLIQYKPQVRP